jgi:pyrroloquinoline quinone biosynthesis protein B
MIAAGLATKTGRSMGHISMSGEQGAISALENLGIERKIFLHINNSNPALLHNSEERRTAEQAGWQIPADGTEIVL